MTHKAEWVFPDRKPLTRKELDVAGCGIPGCTCTTNTLYLQQRCHPGKGLQVLYNKTTGTLIVHCKKCDEFVAEYAVSI